MTENPGQGIRNLAAVEVDPHPIGDRWAVIVGISRYKHRRIRNLKYADRDALKFHELLQQPSAGGFKDERVLRLIDRDATTVAMNHALLSFLKRPGPDDLVIMYFACHGLVDSDRSTVAYLLTHDTDPTDIPGTAVPMRVVQFALKDILHASRVVILADTCHSAALIPSDGLRAAIQDEQVIHRHLVNVSRAKPGVAVLTSAARTEPSREGGWGGGHGVFTHYLLEGWRGAADGYKGRADGKVSLGELFDYVSDHVKADTNGLQHPIASAHFDPDLPVANLAGLRAPEHYEAGIGMLRLAQLGSERPAFRSAARHLREAIDTTRDSGTDHLPAQLAHARALVGAGLADQARVRLGNLDATALSANALWDRAAVFAGYGDWPQASKAFAAFAVAAGQDARSAFAAAFPDSPPARLMAIVIGVDEYIHLAEQHVWCRNDAARMAQLLTAAGFRTIALTGAEATADAVRSAITGLHDPDRPDALRPTDHVVIFYSGSNLTDKDGIEDPYLRFHDFQKVGENYQGTLTGGDILKMVSDLPARVLMIIDGDCHRALMEKVRENPIFDIMFGASPGQRACIMREPEPIGRFTLALCESTRDRKLVDLSYGEWLGSARRFLKDQHVEPIQSPLLFGDHKARLRPGDEITSVLRYIDGEQTIGVSDAVLRRRYNTVCNSYMNLHGGAHLRFAHDFLERRLFEDAERAFARAIAHGNREGWLGLAAVRAIQDPPAAIEALQQSSTNVPEADAPRTSALVDAVTAAIGPGARRAVLIAGLADAQTHAPATEAIELVSRFLRERLAVHADDIVTLTGEAASLEGVTKTVQELVCASPGCPILFYYRGDIATPGNALILHGPHGAPDFLDLEQLAETCKAASQWLTILDARHVDRPAREHERVQHTSHVGLRDIADPDPVLRSIAIPVIGAATLVPDGYQGIAQQLTFLSNTSNGGRWRESLEPVRVYGTLPAGPVLGNVAAILGAVRKYRTSWLVALRQLLERSIEDREKTAPWPEGHADLADVLLAAGAYADSAKEYRLALRLLQSQPSSSAPESITAIQRAHRGLGRALLETGTDCSDAVTALKNAVHARRDDALAHYFLSEAIRMLVERETLEEAAKALDTYRDLGAPLGHLSDLSLD